MGNRNCLFRSLVATLLLLVTLPFASLAEERSREQLKQQLALLEKSVPEIDSKTRKILGDLGDGSKNEYTKRRDQLNAELKEWNVDLVLGTPEDFDIEARREELRDDIRLWTRTISAWNLDELQDGIADALVIAEFDGLNVSKLKNLYQITKEIVRTADFVPPNTTELGKLDALNLATSDRPSTQLYTTFMKLFFLGSVLEEIESRARGKHQRYRQQLYKRAVVAYIRALISGNEKVQPCTKSHILAEVPANSGLLKILGCPDPVVEKLKAYAQAVQKIQSADAEMFKAEASLLIAEQQFVSDLMSAAPLVGEALDIYGIIWDQDIAGQCLSTEEKAISAVFLALPYLGKAAPWAIKQIEKRSPLAAELIAKFRLIFTIVGEESASALTYAYREMGIDLTERLAKRFDTSSQQLTKAMNYFESFRPKMGMKAQGDMITFRTVRDAVESRHWRDQLPPSALNEAQVRSAKVVKENLGNYQLSRSARIKASNLVPEHIPALELVSKEKDQIIVVRYVNEASTEIIAGGAGTKHMGIKGKSASRGPIRALLPVNQGLNKQGSRLEDLLTAQKNRTLDQVELDEINLLRKGMAEGEASMKKCLKDPNCAIAVEYPVRNPVGDGDVILQVAKDTENGRHCDGNNFAGR